MRAMNAGTQKPVVTFTKTAVPSDSADGVTGDKVGCVSSILLRLRAIVASMSASAIWHWKSLRFACMSGSGHKCVLSGHILRFSPKIVENKISKVYFRPGLPE